MAKQCGTRRRPTTGLPAVSRQCPTIRGAAIPEEAVQERITTCMACPRMAAMRGVMGCTIDGGPCLPLARGRSCPEQRWPPTLLDLRERTCQTCRWYEENDPALGYAGTCELLQRDRGAGMKPCAPMLAELLRTSATHPDRKCPWRGLSCKGE